MENNATRKALLASTSLSPFVPSDGTGPFVETTFAASKLKMNASRSAGDAAGGAGGSPPVAVEPILVIITGSDEASRFLTNGVDGFPLRRRVLPRDHMGQFLVDASIGTAGEYKKLIRDSIATCDFVLFYESGYGILAFATIDLREEDKSLEVTLLMSFFEKEGFGTDLLKTVNDIAKAAGYTSIVVKSIADVQPFYEKSGYKKFGMENSLVLMSKPVTRRRRANRRKGTRRRRT